MTDQTDKKAKKTREESYEDTIKEIAKNGRTDSIGTFPRDIRLYSIVIATGFLYLGELIKKKG